MSDLLQLVKNYSIRYDQEIKKICIPLTDHFNISVFTYCFIENDGRFGYISSATEFTDYYFSQNFILSNPYMAHPSLFRSGSILCPCSFNDEEQLLLKKRFKADHFLLSIETNESLMEFFMFANEGVNESGGSHYLPLLDPLSKFRRYFKREAKTLLGRMRADQYNIKAVRGEKLFETCPSSLPLAHNDSSLQSFLKEVSGLSPQEMRCLTLFQKGHSAQATAALMNLSKRTVEHYFENIKNKLGCHSKFDLLNY